MICGEESPAAGNLSRAALGTEQLMLGLYMFAIVELGSGRLASGI